MTQISPAKRFAGVQRVLQGMLRQIYKDNFVQQRIHILIKKGFDGHGNL
jgi:hypothetical protein